MDITLGDIIGYALTFIFGTISGIQIQKHKTSIVQKKNIVKNGDMIGQKIEL